MFLNRKEQIAALALCGALCVGAGVSYFKNRYPDRVEDFGVVQGAVTPAGEVGGAPEGADSTQPVAPMRSRPATLAAAADTARTAGGPIDLNRATAGDLERLPRVGPALARRIVAHRDQHGPFRRVEDLRRVKGIGEKTLERLRPLVKVEELQIAK